MNFINSQKEEIEEFVKVHPPPQQDKWNIKNEWMKADQYSTWQSERHWYIGKAWTKMSPLGLLPHRPILFPKLTISLSHTLSCNTFIYILLWWSNINSWTIRKSHVNQFYNNLNM